ncbi:hypothetical protein [Enterovirga sp. CN4-39]|uniref:hypothetical protein n=1 Tax=Enterovirga sp. CN4-39 TaxID=3400910 RepID=UPI003C0442E5
MRRAYLTFAALGVSSLMATSAFAQGAVQREGTDAGGPRNSMRATETAPAKKAMKSGKATRSSTTGSVRGGKAEKMGTDAGGPRVQGIPGQKQ